MKTQIVTLQTPRGQKVNLTPAQIKTIEAQGTLYGDRGEPFANVSQGQHQGVADLTDAEVAEAVKTAADSSFPGRVYLPE